MKPEDVEIWFLANNILPELTNLFEDFCLSLFYLMEDTYLGDYGDESRHTRIGMTKKNNMEHFEWCWTKTIDNFKKENINFKFENNDYDFFKEFFFEVFYEQKGKEMKDGLKSFLEQLFNLKKTHTKSDLEMFTDVYKTLERSLQI